MSHGMTTRMTEFVVYEDFIRMREKGKVRYIGASGHCHPDMIRCSTWAMVVCVPLLTIMALAFGILGGFVIAMVESDGKGLT